MEGAMNSTMHAGQQVKGSVGYNGVTIQQIPMTNPAHCPGAPQVEDPD
jgi:hypothetical protein